VKTFADLSAAKAWRADTYAQVSRGERRATAPATFREIAESWIEKAENGEILTRSGDPYKPSALRGYRQGIELYLIVEVGHLRIGNVERRDLQRIVGKLQAEGRSASTVRNAIMPARRIFAWAKLEGYANLSPLDGLELPAVRGRRDRIATPAEAAALIGALPEGDRALWATAGYAGLRSGELRALDWSNVDLDAGIIRVGHAWDQKAGRIAPKSQAGVRDVPLSGTLRPYLAAHWLRAGRPTGGLVFGRSATNPFNPSSVNNRAKKAWATVEPKPLESIGLHELRHTFASFMIAAGVDFKKLSTYMGHPSVQITLDRYGHLLPGDEADSSAKLDAYIERTTATGS